MSLLLLASFDGSKVEAGITLLAVTLFTMLVLSFVTKRFSKIYYRGVEAWSNWLPVICVLLYLLLLGANLSTSGEKLGWANLQLSFLEKLGLFLVGPLLFTRLAPVISLSAVYFLFAKSGWTNAHHAGSTALAGCLLVVAIIGDKMPWIYDEGRSKFSHRVREILVVIIAVLGLGLSLAALLKIGALTPWLHRTLGLKVTPEVCLLLVAVSFAGWLTIAFGFTRHFTIPFLALPSLCLLSFLTSAHGAILVAPFAACIALSLATADRRHIRRRNA